MNCHISKADNRTKNIRFIQKSGPHPIACMLWKPQRGNMKRLNHASFRSDNMLNQTRNQTLPITHIPPNATTDAFG